MFLSQEHFFGCVLQLSFEVAVLQSAKIAIYFSQLLTGISHELKPGYCY